MSQLQYKRWVELTNPHSWLLTADTLHGQALQLYRGMGRSTVTATDAKSGQSKTSDQANKAVFLLGGFVLENLIKGFLVYENPSWIANGKIHRRLRTHSLTKLQTQSRYIPYKNRYLWVLESFERGLDSWARYPAGLSVQQNAEELNMAKQLWVGYLSVTHAYATRLRKLLAKVWRGPHGFEGRYTINKGFLTILQ